MPTHDIIDNRHEKLVDHINRILASTESARFAVGYFFLSGLESIAERLHNVTELRLLVGNTTNRETLEQLAEGYQRLELVRDAAEAQTYPKRTEAKRMVEATAANIRSGAELMDQTDEGEALVRILARMIEEKRLKVRVYTKGRMHAKAYIFDYGPIFDASGKPMARHEKGIAIVGSSNLTLSGVTHNTELNVVVQGNDNHTELVRWFEALWNESQDFDEALMQEMRQSWAMAMVRPYDIYMKTLYTLVKDRLEGEDGKEILWDDEIIHQLANFQKVAVRQAVRQRAIELSHGPILAMFDDDIILPHAQWLSRAVAAFQLDRRASTVWPVLIPPPGANWVTRCFFDLNEAIFLARRRRISRGSRRSAAASTSSAST